MDALKLFAAVGAVLFAASSAVADPVDHWRAEIADASVRFGVPAAWIERVRRAEKGRLTVLNGWPVTGRGARWG